MPKRRLDWRRLKPGLLPGDVADKFQKLPVGQDYWTQLEPVPGLPTLVRFGVAADGRFVVTGIVIGADGPVEITARALRELRLGEFAALMGSAIREGTKPDGDPGEAFTRLVLRQAGRWVKDEKPVPHLRPGPRGWPKLHYQRVARLYRQALIAAPKAPVRYLAKNWPTSDASARRWLKTARDMGLLRRAQLGKPGEQPVKRRKSA
jgi:hypothetical protein